MADMLRRRVSQPLATNLRSVAPVQAQFPVAIPPEEIARKRTLGAAIELCMEYGGRDDTSLRLDLKVDKAQLSRWKSGAEGIVWPKLATLQAYCGNEAPTLWMLHQSGWDLHSIRRIESETERENRLLREEVTALRRALRGAI